MNPELAAILARVAQREGVPPALLLGAVASMGAAGKPDFSRINPAKGRGSCRTAAGMQLCLSAHHFNWPFSYRAESLPQ